MKVKEAMSTTLEVISSDATIQEAAKKMSSVDVGSLPVVDNGELVGIVTDRDITIRATAEGLAPDECRVSEVMSTSPDHVFEEDDISDAANVMKTRQIRRLPVLNRDKELVGILSLADVAVEGNDQLSGDALEGISQPTEPKG